MIQLFLCTLFLTLPLLADETSKPLLFNLKGIYTHPISTKSSLAQKYFDQGMIFFYGYNYEQAEQAFKEAAKLDPDCAICYWGQALSLRGNMDSLDEIPQAIEKINQAQKLMSKATVHEQAYITALANALRTNPDSLKELDTAIMQEMKKVSQQYPDDLDAAVLYAKTEMDTTDELEDVKQRLLAVLKIDPNHPGANHFYIHAVDPSKTPADALESAKKLEHLIPFAGHLLHMSAHIYYKTGNYNGATAANLRAIKADKELFNQGGVKNKYFSGFHMHNWQFLIASLIMEGKEKDALQAMDQIEALIKNEKPKLSPFYINAFPPQRLLVLHRFSQWDQILKEPKPQAPFGIGVWHFARAMAFLEKNDLKNAQIEADAIDDESVPMTENDMNLLLKVYALNAQAAIAEKEGDQTKMVKDYQEAILLEDEVYSKFEPPLMFFSSKENFGRALIRAGKTQAGKQLLEEDLKRHPNKIWSQRGLK